MSSPDPSRKIIPVTLTTAAFAPFGDVLEVAGLPDKLINQGLCERFHDRAQLDFGTDGRAGLSLFNAQPRALPYLLELVERHPDGSQAFIPMHTQPFLVIVAHDRDGLPDAPQAFLTTGAQAINFHRNVWHGVLTPLASPGLFAVIDRIGQSPNLQEHWFIVPWQVVGPG